MCTTQTGNTIIKKKKVRGAGTPDDCADLCEGDTEHECILWVFNKKARPFVCIHVVLKGNFNLLVNFSSSNLIKHTFLSKKILCSVRETPKRQHFKNI